MITYNFDINDRIVNGSLGTVLGIRVSSTNLLNGEILVLFDDPKAGNSLKIKNGPFKGAIRIKAEVKSFSLKGKSNVVVSRKQYPLTAAHAITIHKSQGQTYQYVIADFDRATRTGRGKKPINCGKIYTAISRREARKRSLIKMFDANTICVTKCVLLLTTYAHLLIQLLIFWLIFSLPL